MKEWNGRPVLKMTVARLLPPSSAYPDCLCFLVLTADTFYVLEDNFDNSYTTHFTIPLSRLITIEKYIQPPEEGGSPAGSSTAAVIVGLVLGAIAGLVVIPGSEMKKPQKKFIRICYLDESGNRDSIFFSEVSGNIKHFTKYCQRQINNTIEASYR